MSVVFRSNMALCLAVISFGSFGLIFFNSSSTLTTKKQNYRKLIWPRKVRNKHKHICTILLFSFVINLLSRASSCRMFCSIIFHGKLVLLKIHSTNPFSFNKPCLLMTSFFFGFPLSILNIKNSNLFLNTFLTLKY